MTESAQTWTVRRLLEWTGPFLARKGADAPRLAAELLLAHVLHIPRIKLYTDYERPLSGEELADFRELVRRAGEHEPIAYLIGKAHFFNLELMVNSQVLIPRPDTETLVENIIQFCRHQAGFESPRILDLCTGSGCIAAALAANLKSAVILATDLSPGAVEVARANLEHLGLADRVTVEQGDLFEPLARTVDAQPFHVLVANPPYIATGHIAGLARNVRDFEPRSALDGGPDGLAVHQRILAGAPQRLAAGAAIFLEIAADQGPAALELISRHPAFSEPRILKDYAGHDRVLAARRP